MHGRSITKPIAAGGASAMSNAYTCDASTLRMAIPMGDGAIENVYRKVGGPAE
ncbi:hypothetical protein H1235_08290 [Pseudoxanthomonas sp. NC8]|nr:hypothetical protein H1235_08290 [Pseudoxanthomonas sp. NC8]